MLFQKMKIGVKIIGGYLIVILLLALVAVISLVGMRTLNTSVHGIMNEHVPAADASMEMMNNLTATRDLMGSYWIQEDPAARKELRQEFDRLIAEFDAFEKKLRALSTTQDEVAQLESAVKGHMDFEKSCRAYMDALDEELQTKIRVETKMEEYDAAINRLTGSDDLNVLLWKQAMAANDFIISGNETRVRDYAELQRQIERRSDFARIAAAQGAVFRLGEELIKAQQEHLADASAAAGRMTELDKIGDTIDVEQLDKIEQDNAKDLQDAGEQAISSGRVSTNITLLIAVLALVIGILIGVVITRMIVSAVGGEPAEIEELARKVAEGDLSVRLGTKSRRSTGIFRSICEMVEKLNYVLHRIQEASVQVASSSEEITSSAQQLAEGAQSQASTLEETSAGVEELTASVEQVSDHAQSQAASVEETSSNMNQMQTSVHQVSKTLEEVGSASNDSMVKAQAGADAVGKAVEAIKAISASSEQIAGIIGVIGDIADQTNLLALNAAIEAARAGEHGRGFAVVADEVSKLADRSSSSTKEIEKLIRESSRSVASGVEIATAALSSMEAIIAGAKRTNQVVEALASDLGQQINAIKEMGKATESIAEMSQSISAATEEQTSNAKQVSKAIENVNELTQQAAGAAEEMSSATEELSGLAQQLQRMVEQFRLAEESGSDHQTARTGGNGGGRLPNRAEPARADLSLAKID